MKSLLLISFLTWGYLAAATPISVSKEFWTSPDFTQSFNGSYRINAELEPNLSGEERALLIQMQEKMASNEISSLETTLKASPLLNTSASIQYNYANVLRQKGDLTTAISYYEKAIKTLPSFRRAHQNLGIAHFQSANYQLAEKHLLEAINLGSENALSNGLLGYCFLNKSNYEAALLSYRKALRHAPENIEWKSGLARSLQSLNRIDEALIIYETLLEAQPNNSDITLQIALIHLQNDQLDQAIPGFELLRRRNALDDEYKILLGSLLISQKNFLVGASILKNTISSPQFTQSDSALKAIRFCLEARQLDTANALHILLKDKELSKSQAQTYQRLKAQLYFSEKNGHPEGIAILEMLVLEDPMDEQSLLLLGQQLVITKQPHQALLRFEQAITSKPGYTQAMLQKAQLLVTLQRYNDAITDLENYLDIKEEKSVSQYLEAVKKLKKSVEL